jgi:hypothetical protein
VLAASREYVNKNVDLGKLADDVEEYFELQGYTTQKADKENWHLIQAKKAGFLRDIAAADRAFTVLLTGEQNNFKVSIGVGKWLQNMAVSFLEGLLLTPLVFFVEIPVQFWSYEIEGRLWEFTDKQVELRSVPVSS